MFAIKSNNSTAVYWFGTILAIALAGCIAWHQLYRFSLTGKGMPGWLVDYTNLIVQQAPETRSDFLALAAKLNATVVGLDTAALPVYQQVHVLFARGLALAHCAQSIESVKCLYRARATVRKLNRLLVSPRLTTLDRLRLAHLRFGNGLNVLHDMLCRAEARVLEQSVLPL